ncbi:MAG TPA: HAMP domain-containing histidine kinase [Desulfobacteraceae bacterium]|nr:HAMP domain-containing histidine kinase [Desulfobacteraceae bacterium]
MKIRHRITLWIAFAGLLSSLSLSLTVILLMWEESYEMLDQELSVYAHALDNALSVLPDGSITLGSSADALNSPYWIRLTDDQGRPIYASPMTGLVDLPLRQNKERYTVNTSIPLTWLLPGQEEEDLASFRVRVFPLHYEGRNYHLQIARPVENLRWAVVELAITIMSGLLISALVLIVAGYYTAGRILRPIQDINAIAQVVNEKNLGQRIPLDDTHDELHELSAALNSMFDRLQFSFLRQKEFIANASHELKTPLTLLRLSFEEALQSEDLPDSLKQRLSAQNIALLRMNRLVKNLLDLSSLELTETCEAETFAFSELARSVLEDFQPLIQNQGIHCTVQLDDQLNLIADPEKIKRMLINLVDNAIKYNRKDGKIRLQAGQLGQNCDILLFNTGPGIPAADQERVFEQFYRVEKSRAASLGGAGLGLTIVRRIVEFHGGTVSLQSKPGEWTQVHVVLPLHG